MFWSFSCIHALKNSGSAGKKLLVATASWKTKREPMARCIRFMRPQAGGLGKHDFDPGRSCLFLFPLFQFDHWSPVEFTAKP